MTKAFAGSTNSTGRPRGRGLTLASLVVAATVLASGVGRAEASEPVSDTSQNIIVGTIDGRDVQLSNLNRFPLRAVGALSTSPDAGTTGCTGTLVGPRHVLTAAHCLYDTTGNWFWPLYFHPGQAGTNQPNGAARKALYRWAPNYLSDRAWDFGIIVLEDLPETAGLGSMGMWYWNDLDIYEGKWAANLGYPGADQQCADSPLADGTCGGYMYQDTCKVAETTYGVLRHTCDTTEGHSGGPVYGVNGAGQQVIMAVHDGGSGLMNSGARVRPEMVNWICFFMKQHPSKYASTPLCK